MTTDPTADAGLFGQDHLAALSEQELSRSRLLLLRSAWTRRLLARRGATAFADLQPFSLFVGPVFLASGVELYLGCRRERSEAIVYVRPKAHETGMDLWTELNWARQIIERELGQDMTWGDGLIFASTPGGFLHPRRLWDGIQQRHLSIVHRLATAIEPWLERHVDVWLPDASPSWRGHQKKLRARLAADEGEFDLMFVWRQHLQDDLAQVLAKH